MLEAEADQVQEAYLKNAFTVAKSSLRPVLKLQNVRKYV
jgi:hypothetical protein